MDVAVVNSFIIYDKLHPNMVSFLDFRFIIPKSLNGSFVIWITLYAYCSICGIGKHKLVMCVICDTPLCVQKKRNCFLLHHQDTNKMKKTVLTAALSIWLQRFFFRNFLTNYFEIQIHSMVQFLIRIYYSHIHKSSHPFQKNKIIAMIYASQDWIWEP